MLHGCSMLRRSPNFRLWCRVVWRKNTDVSDQFASSNLRLVLGQPFIYPDTWCNSFAWNVAVYLPIHKESRP